MRRFLEWVRGPRETLDQQVAAELYAERMRCEAEVREAVRQYEEAKAAYREAVRQAERWENAAYIRRARAGQGTGGWGMGLAKPPAAPRLKMGDKVENPTLRGDMVGTVERITWAEGKLWYVFVSWPDEKRWEIPHLLRHKRDE